MDGRQYIGGIEPRPKDPPPRRTTRRTGGRTYRTVNGISAWALRARVPIREIPQRLENTGPMATQSREAMPEYSSSGAGIQGRRLQTILGLLTHFAMAKRRSKVKVSRGWSGKERKKLIEFRSDDRNRKGRTSREMSALINSHKRWSGGE